MFLILIFVYTHNLHNIFTYYNKNLLFGRCEMNYTSRQIVHGVIWVFKYRKDGFLLIIGLRCHAGGEER